MKPSLLLALVIAAFLWKAYVDRFEVMERVTLNLDEPTIEEVMEDYCNDRCLELEP